MSVDAKRFFTVDDGDADYWVVARDVDHARSCFDGVEFGDPSKSLREAEAAGELTIEEVGEERARQIRCHTDEDRRGRGAIPLAECELGERFSSEF